MRLLGIVVAVLLLSACGGSAIEPLDPPASLEKLKPQLDVRQRWGSSVDKGADGHYLPLRPLVHNGLAVINDRRGLIYARDAVSGNRLWRRDLGVPLYTSAAAGAGLLLFGGDAEVIALERNSGEVRWRQPVSSEVLATPVVAGERVIVRTGDGRVHALNLADGASLWSYEQKVPELSLRGVAEPLVLDQIVICGFANGKVVALDLASGIPGWQVAVSEARGRDPLERLADVDAQLANAGRVVFAAGYNGRINAIDAPSGQVLWSRDIPSFSGMVANNRALYIVDENSDLWALDVRSGSTLWKQDDLHRRGLTAPVLQGEWVVVGDYKGYLHWFDGFSGMALARVRVEEWWVHLGLEDAGPYDFESSRAISGIPVVADEWVFAQDQSGVVAAFEVRPANSQQD